jgi:hypothetical protein
MGPRRVSPARWLALTFALGMLASGPAAASSRSLPTEAARTPVATESAAARGPVDGDDRAMRYQGGRVLLDPRVYVVFWGSEWGQPDATGMPTVDPLSVAPTVVDFFGRLGGRGDTWSTILTQYCSGTKVNASSCGPGSRRIPRLTRPPLRGWWVDASPGPGQSNLDVQMGAWHEVTDRALSHFGATHPDDIVVLMLPPGTQSANCTAFHTVAHTAQHGPHPLIVMTYPLPPGPACPGLPPVCNLGQPAECLPDTAHTITGWASHEYAEVVTNPFPRDCLRTSGFCGWIVKDAPVWASRAEPTHTEISDTCSNYRFVQLNGKKVSVATLWSNTANKGEGGCVARYISDRDQS